MKFSVLNFLFILFWIGCSPVYTIEKTNQTEYVLSDSSNNTIDSTVYAYISPYKLKMESEMNVYLAESESALEKGSPEGKLGNFVADACMKETSKIFYPADGKPADFAVFNNGGLRRPLPGGKIMRKDVFELMPFENELVVLTLNGNSVKKIFNFIASKNGAPVSGVHLQIKEKQALNIFINNIPLDTTHIYKVLTSDYLANGGDSFDMLMDAPREKVNLKVRDAIIQFLEDAGRKGIKINVSLDGRISDAK